MAHPSRLTVFLLAAWLGGMSARPASAASDFAFYHENVMGTSLELRVQAESAEAARAAEDRVLREIDRLTLIFSGYDPSSEFRRWQSAPKGPLSISTELVDILQASDHWNTMSGGAFDPRVQALTRLWNDCAARDRTPTAEELASVKTLMSGPAWRVDLKTRTAERLTDCPLSLNAIAKGYIIDRACDVALKPAQGVRGVLLNVGGDLCVRGESARTIGIASPSADSESSEPLTYIHVRDRAVATSGNSQRGFRIRDHWYSHILDPRSGTPASGTASATVIAKRSADADALATIFNVLAPEESLRLANALPEVECLIVTTDGQIERSQEWNRYERPQSLLLAVAPQANDTGAARASRGGMILRWSSTSRSTNPNRRGGVIVVLTSPSGSRMRTATRSDTWSCGSRSVGPGRIAGCRN